MILKLNLKIHLQNPENQESRLNQSGQQNPRSQPNLKSLQKRITKREALSQSPNIKTQSLITRKGNQKSQFDNT